MIDKFWLFPRRIFTTPLTYWTRLIICLICLTGLFRRQFLRFGELVSWVLHLRDFLCRICSIKTRLLGPETVGRHWRPQPHNSPLWRIILSNPRHNPINPLYIIALYFFRRRRLSRRIFFRRRWVMFNFSITNSSICQDNWKDALPGGPIFSRDPNSWRNENRLRNW